MRVTEKHLATMANCVNAYLQQLGKVGRYDLEYCYGHTNVVFYSAPETCSGCADVRCGLTKGEAMDVLQGIWHALNTVIYGK